MWANNSLKKIISIYTYIQYIRMYTHTNVCRKQNNKECYILFTVQQ